MPHINPIQASTTTALLGAGASVESGVPAAIPLMKALITDLVDVPWARAGLLAAIERRSPRSLYEYLRFEQLLEWITEVFDNDLGFLAFLDDFATPSRIHRSVARSARDGLALVTVNFDDLLERAVLSEGVAAVTLDAHQACTAPPPPGIGIVKLHGSQRWHSPSASPRAPQATVDRIAAANPGMALNGRAGELLQSLVDGRTLIVCGYSASDDLDVVPALGGTNPDRVVWFDWDPSTPRRLPAHSWRTDTSGWADLVRSWERSGAEVAVIRGDTTEALSLVGLTVPPPVRIDATDWRSSVKRWADRVRWRDPRGLGFAGLVFGDLEMGDLSVRAFSESRSTRMAGATWTTHRRLYELAQAFLLKTPSEPDRARKFALRSLQAAERSGEPGDEAYAHLLLGRIESLRPRGSDAKAEGHFASAMNLAEIDSLEWAFAAERQANALARSGQAAASIRLARPAVAIFRREGLISNEVDGLMVLALAGAEDGSWGAVDTCLEQAEALATKLGYVERTYEIHELRAAVLFDRGDLASAETAARSALEALDGEPHDEVALAYAILGRVARERGQYGRSLDYFETAIRLCSTIVNDLVPSMVADRAEVLLLQGDKRSAMAAVKAAESMGSRDWATTTYLAAIRQSVSLSDRDTAHLSKALCSRPAGVARGVAVHLGMSIARLGITARGTLLTLYRAEQAARRLGAGDRASFLAATRLGIK